MTSNIQDYQVGGSRYKKVQTCGLGLAIVQLHGGWVKEKGYTLDGARIALTTNAKISETVSIIDRLEFVKSELQKLKESLVEKDED